MLEGVGHSVEEAANGEECLRKYRAVHPHVILMDIVMPVREGVETITELRRHDTKVAIIAITGGGSIGTALLLDIAMGVGATRALAKPVRKDDLLAAVQDCLDEAALTASLPERPAAPGSGSSPLP